MANKKNEPVLLPKTVILLKIADLEDTIACLEADGNESALDDALCRLADLKEELKRYG